MKTYCSILHSKDYSISYVFKQKRNMLHFEHESTCGFAYLQVYIPEEEYSLIGEVRIEHIKNDLEFELWNTQSAQINQISEEDWRYEFESIKNNNESYIIMDSKGYNIKLEADDQKYERANEEVDNDEEDEDEDNVDDEDVDDEEDYDGPNYGTVIFFNTEKGFGWIKPKDGSDDIFVHISQLEGITLSEGDSVIYNIVEGRKGPMAGNVLLCD